MKNLTSEAASEGKIYASKEPVDVAKNRQFIQNNKNLEQTWFVGHMIHPALFLIILISSPSC